MRKTSKFWIFIFAFLLVISTHLSKLNAQMASGINMQNLATVKVDDLSDDQVFSFWTRMKSSGLSLNQLEAEASKRKMPAAEFAKLKQRIENINSQQNTPAAMGAGARSYLGNVQEEKDKTADLAFAALKPKIFGAELFSNKNLSFEPNLKMATPLNYQLGPDDELIIDIYGFSEETYNVKVSPDGFARLPYAGPVQVSGLTVDQAKKKIIQNLSKTYDRINTGETKVSVTLGNIRSIKVIIVGEVNLPGTYTLPSLATVFNALYASGGPGNNGSMRNIKVIRDNKTVSTLDVYEFMLNGDAKGNIRLQDQDIIKVGSYQNRVELKGQVKREGLFEITKNESIKDVLNFAGGFTDNAYRERIKVIRNTSKQKSVADVSSDLFGMFSPKSGDVYIVDNILDRYENRVQINGAVFRPGYYALEEGLTVSKLIKKAEGFREDAFMTRAIIYRLKEDNTLEVLSFNTADIVSGKTKDVLLKREDVIQIASEKELKEGYNVSINGEVLRPGNFAYADNMRIEDLIIAAGGLKESASIKRIEVARRKKDADKLSKTGDIAIIKQFDVEKDLKDNEASKFILEPFDVVTVFPSSGYVAQKTIRVEGEVLFPGVYTISKNDEHISDIIQRSGGLTASAFADGAILLRPKLQTITDQYIKENKLKALKKQSKDSNEVFDQIEEEGVNGFDIVGIDLAQILKKPNSKTDFLLREGDIIKIPFEKQTVMVSGEVLYPVRVKYKKSMGLKAYISNAGGFGAKAIKRRAYVVYANGTAKATKNFLGINFYPKIKAGSEIVIPQRPDRKTFTTLEFTSLLTAMTTLGLITFTLLK
jgi:protein involved in polysaccharide export with SLBB domain